MQRFLDIFLSLTAIVFLSPILITVSIILKFTGENEIFYEQERVGIHGKTFGVLKFATMLKNSPNIGAGEITVKNDPRVLPFGKFLRKSKINELPQLWNIFVGDMSIVGPRPMVPNTFAKYDTNAQNRLNSIRPGLTGIGSIVFRDEEKLLEDKSNAQEFYSNHIIPYKANLETWYVDNVSLSLYLKCIFITAWVVIFPKSKIHLNFLRNLPSIPDNLK
tara:strand:- start:1232 stop:1888 length:657 start_codon:yes stop_codon:yes gene_type:complete